MRNNTLGRKRRKRKSIKLTEITKIDCLKLAIVISQLHIVRVSRCRL